MGDWVLPDYRPIVKQQSQPEENDQKSGYWLFWCGLLPCFRSQQHPRRHICIELHFRHLRSAEAVKFTPGQAYKRQEAIANANPTRLRLLSRVLKNRLDHLVPNLRSICKSRLKELLRALKTISVSFKVTKSNALTPPSRRKRKFQIV